jgi:hypothetical protein
MNLKPYNYNIRSKSIITATIIAMSLFSAATLLSLQSNLSVNAQNQKTTQSQSTNAKGTNASAAIGNIQQLSKAGCVNLTYITSYEMG